MGSLPERRRFRRVRVYVARVAVLCAALMLGACPKNLTEPSYVLTVSPPAATLFVEDSARFTATLRDSDGNEVTATFAWSVNNPAVATVGPDGTVRAHAPGSAVIEVGAEGVTASATVTVSEDNGQILTVAPGSATLYVGNGIRFTSVLRDRNGDTLTASPVWTSSNPSVAGVDATGRVTGAAPGSATIRATVNALSAEAAVTVQARPTGGSAVLVGAGDIANCDDSGDERTADLLDDIPGTVFTAGDNAYPNGSPTEFSDCYHPSWGRHKARTRPAAGNHEYHTPGAGGHFGYFGSAAGDPARGYYSYDLGAWHVIVLNSNLMMGAGSPQEQWLRQDLADNPALCTVAYWHHPRFSSSVRGGSGVPQGAWHALYEAGADLVIVAHDHTYERFAPQTPLGQLDLARGMRQIIVGTGGAGLHEFGVVAPNSEARGNETKGVLKLTLHADRYNWEFIPVAGGDFTDSGSSSCH
jgi:hypothetical protein